jgi:ATP-dependent Clp protease ATP-binding subunit ClpX
LKFTEQSLRAIAQLAIKRKTGARGLRSVIEEAMLDVMFEIPSKKNVKQVIIDEEVITKGKKPEVIYKNQTEDSDSGSDSEIA